MQDRERRRNSASQHSETELPSALKRAATMTEIVKLLNSDEPIENIMHHVLALIGEYLDITHGFVGHLHRGEDSLARGSETLNGAGGDDRIDYYVQWAIGSKKPLFEDPQDRERSWFLRYDKPLYVSFHSELPEEKRKLLSDIGLTAIAVLPLFLNGQIAFYVCFGETRRHRDFNSDEMSFMEDAVRILESILMRRIQRNSLASSFASLEAILDNVGSSVYVRDLKTNGILFANQSLRENFARELQEGTLASLFEEGNKKVPSGASREIFHEARNSWYELYQTQINWVDGSPVSLFAIHDITEKKRYQNKIEIQAYTDFLTGLYNRMCCERDLGRYLEETVRNGTKGGLFYIDLDDFKHINDGLGHQYGDILLQSISHSIRDIDGIHNSCYRMGGDEFVIIVPPASYEHFDRILREVKTVFARPWFLKDADYYCTMSMGTIEFPTDGTSVDDVIRKADIAMYEAKKSGKNRVAAYSENLTSVSARRLDMEKSMRDAADQGYEEFEVFYQPIMDITMEGSPCVGAEALIRWNSSQMGFLTPTEFIPLAEYLGLINPIGNYVAEQACTQCRLWNDMGADNFHINVNLSVVQLLQNDIVEVVQNAIRTSGIKPGNLTLEVTESLAINDLDRTKDILERIKALGVRLALDDFGTGYSSLNNIRVLPFDIIKVDQNFVKDLAEDNYSQSFIRMVAELGEAIGAEICVEGIETRSQYRILEGMHVRYIQGFYFNQPLSREEFEALYIAKGKEKPRLKK